MDIAVWEPSALRDNGNPKWWHPRWSVINCPNGTEGQEWPRNFRPLNNQNITPFPRTEDTFYSGQDVYKGIDVNKRKWEKDYFISKEMIITTTDWVRNDNSVLEVDILLGYKTNENREHNQHVFKSLQRQKSPTTRREVIFVMHA